MVSLCLGRAVRDISHSLILLGDSCTGHLPQSYSAWGELSGPSPTVLFCLGIAVRDNSHSLILLGESCLGDLPEGSPQAE